jgi:hypothetical protein
MKVCCHHRPGGLCGETAATTTLRQLVVTRILPDLGVLHGQSAVWDSFHIPCPPIRPPNIHANQTPTTAALLGKQTPQSPADHPSSTTNSPSRTDTPLLPRQSQPVAIPESPASRTSTARRDTPPAPLEARETPASRTASPSARPSSGPRSRGVAALVRIGFARHFAEQLARRASAPPPLRRRRCARRSRPA